MLRKFKSLSKLGKFGAIAGVFSVLAVLGSAGGSKQANLESTNTGVLGAQAENNNEPKEKAPVITTKEVTETQVIPFESTTVTDPNLAKGTTRVTTVGVAGVSTLTYKVTYADGVETKRVSASNVVTTPPINQVTSVGTYVYVAPAPKPAPTPQANSSCSPNYSGCVPIASDVDCAGGSGNGPAYASGPFNVIGYDIYDLDRDGNGVGCE
jgi:hypothetical protein